ncbi:DUF6491 family protein [Brevundimonas sp. 2R-24]|uniref:DUF6491 family protein n=1 Tax=Peiella sedimenti TaxID=3061083 RepID=A0ABT8SL36_9CAUL|nr:DUF6491 family protein [Caulobacteraceae bacterium XZ-24]
MRTAYLTLAAAAAFAVASCAPMYGPGSDPGMSSSAPRQCFFVNQVAGFSSTDDRNVYLRVGVNDIYHVQIIGHCPDIDWSSRIGIQPRGGGSSVCTGFDADLIVPRLGGGVDRCLIRSVRKLSDAEAAALRNRP